MATLSPYLGISQHILSNSAAPLILPRRSSDDLDAHFDENDFQSNHMDSSRLSLNAPPSLSGLGIRNLNFSKDLESKGYSQESPPISHAQVSLDRSSTYGTLNETLDPCMKPLDNPFSIPSTWSFSSVIKAAELAADEAVHEMRSALSLELGLGDLGTTSMFLDTEDQMSWAFEKLSATPMSHFITQLSASSSDPRQTAILSEIYFGNSIQIPAGDGQTQMSYNSELSLPVIDINMRNPGVNPADILPPLPSPPPLSNDPLYYTLNNSLSTNQPTTVVDDFFGQDNVLKLEYPGLGYQTEMTCQSHNVILPAPAGVDSKAFKQASDDEHSVFRSPTSSDYSPSLKSPVLKQTFSIKGNKCRIARTKECDPVYPEIHDDQAQDLDLPVNLGTPVLDAHRGVELEELKAKAERYRLRNQGREYDKRWLISFAGKLSTRGELVEEFRCYITGCQQVNKRRDHILIHVGAHLDQRPFKCRHWYVFNHLPAIHSYRIFLFFPQVHRDFCARTNANDTNLVTPAFDLTRVIFVHFPQQLSFVKIC